MCCGGGWQKWHNDCQTLTCLLREAASQRRSVRIVYSVHVVGCSWKLFWGSECLPIWCIFWTVCGNFQIFWGHDSYHLNKEKHFANLWIYLFLRNFSALSIRFPPLNVYGTGGCLNVCSRACTCSSANQESWKDLNSVHCMYCDKCCKKRLL